MSDVVLCGTDFTPLAQETARLTLSLARKLGAQFHLIHVTDEPDASRARLQSVAAELGDQVQAEVLAGHPDEALVERARVLNSQLLVVGSLGRRNFSDWLLGSTAERVVRSCPVPSLVVRKPERLDCWLKGQRPLKVMLAVSPDGSVLGALKWLESLERVGPIESFAVRVSGGANLDERWLEEETGRLQACTGLPRAECQVEVAQWPVEEHLISLAEREQVDLIVMGTHLRSGLERLWKGSVSMAVLQRAPMSVACVPGSPQ
ncbi:universal stress protein [bacterium CPR1]|nr:universal stress protein [bacterium CPR1]